MMNTEQQNAQQGIDWFALDFVAFKTWLDEAKSQRATYDELSKAWTCMENTCEHVPVTKSGKPYKNGRCTNQTAAHTALKQAEYIGLAWTQVWDFFTEIGLMDVSEEGPDDE